MVGIAGDPPATNAALARDAGLEFPILADPDLHVIDAYGLRHAGGGPDGRDISHSASVLIDRDGIVRWVYVTQNLRVRPPADAVLATTEGM